MLIQKPSHMFDRDFEWGELSRFVGNPAERATLGIVSGRRRQGKTFLLDALTRQTGGFLFTATESTEADSLRQFGQALSAHLGEPTPFRFADWVEAITRLMQIAAEGPLPVVIDEFPYLAKASPALPSIIQRALDPTAQDTNSPIRLLLCGSAMSFMGGLLAGNAPLRGRAGLELLVPTLDFRLAREFWEISDLRTAALVNAVVGGTPAYRREFVADDAPTGSSDFEPWLTRTVLNPASPLFREARYLLTEETSGRDAAPYHAVLAAITDGNTRRSGIASYLGRKSTDLAHPLSVLVDAGLISHEVDAFRSNRSNYRITEPLLTFYHAVMRPAWGDLERPGRAGHVWPRMRHTFESKVVGPHFESMCRQWLRWHADDEILGEIRPASVASGTVADPDARTTHELDLVVHGRTEDGGRRLLAIGEAKWSEPLGVGHLERLRHIKRLLVAKCEPGADSARLLLCSGSDFSETLQQAQASESDIALVDLNHLYG